MKISLKLIVFTILAVFVVKISVADSWNTAKGPKLSQTRNMIQR
mgnify:CR=1 FL=1